MAPKNESPADKVKRELEEKAQRDKEAEAASKEQGTADKLSPEELAAIDAADRDERAAALQAQLDVANARVKELEEQPQEDPEIVRQRAEKFAKAEAFEKMMAERRNRTMAAEAEDPNPGNQGSVAGMTVPEGSMTVVVPTAAFDIIHRMALSLPLSTPPEHVMCGYAGIKITVGTIRALAGVKMR